ncbi:hypothetical protein BH23BAC2_BH23BAC2_18780 [soil metagenome]
MGAFLLDQASMLWTMQKYWSIYKGRISLLHSQKLKKFLFKVLINKDTKAISYTPLFWITPRY